MPKAFRESGDSTDSADEDVILQVMVPKTVKQQVALRAVHEGTTQRTIVLQALQSIGFEIAESELHDRRKVR